MEVESEASRNRVGVQYETKLILMGMVMHHLMSACHFQEKLMEVVQIFFPLELFNQL
jgi:hypothetical protein